MKKLTVTLLLILVMALACTFIACDSGEGGGDAVKDYTLTQPTNIAYDGEALTWDVVTNAEYYLVSINGAEARKITSPLYVYNAMEQPFSVKITAKNEQNEESAEINFQPLGKIGEITVDAVTGRLTWDPVNYATGYAVRIDGSKEPVMVTTSYMEITTVGKHVYEVKPVMQGDPTYFSSYSAPKTITVLEQVAADSVSYSQGNITWNAVSGAVSYEISINGVVAGTSNSTKFMYDPLGTDFDVTVKAVGNGVDVFSGAASESKSFIFLDPVTGVKIVDGILVWDEVEGASHYRLKLNGREINENISVTQYSGLTEGVTTEVQILPLSSDAHTFSNWSPSISVYLMPAPILQWNSGYNTGNTQTASIFWNWNDTQAVTGFTVKVIDPYGNETITNLPGTQRSFTDPYLLTGDYTVSVQANSAETNIYSSKFSKPITVKRLASPGNNVQKFMDSDPNDITQGFTVTFENVVHASGYHLYQDGNKIREGTALQFKVQNFHDANAIGGQTIDFKIVAVGNNTLVNGVVTLDSLYDSALSFSVNVLPAPTLTGMEGFNLTYTSVSGNNGYRIKAGSKVIDATALSCSLSELEAGGYDVTVCAKGNGQFILPSVPTPSIRIERLDAPKNIRIDTSEASEGVITYDNVLYATGYYIIFNNSGTPVPVDTIDNINQYITEQGTTVHMYSTANYYNNERTVYYMESKGSETMNFIKLAAPTFGDVAFTNTELLWQPSANVNLNVYTPTYQVYLADGTVLNGEKNGTRMDISMLEGGQSYTFMIKAIGDGKTYINSETSTTVTIYKLSTPNVERVGNAYTWRPVANATSYAVYVDGVLDSTAIHVSGELCTYVPAKFKELKDYQVKVYAIGDQGYTSIDSKPCEIIQKVKQLVTPEISFGYDQPTYTNDGKITVTVTKPSPYATAYTYTVGSTHTGATQAETTFSICPGSTGEYEIRVFAVGGGFDEEGNYYIDSQSIGGNARYKITLLASPNPSDMTLSRDGLLTWSAIKNANGYEVTVLKDGSPVVDAQKCSGTTLEIPTYEFDHTYTVEVRALGNGTTIISSELAEREWTVNP